MRCPSLLCSSCSKNKLKGTFCGSKHFPEVPAQSGLSPPCPFLPPVGHYFHLNSVLCPVLASSAYILSNSLKNKVDLSIYLSIHLPTYLPTYLLMHPRYTSSLQKNTEKKIIIYHLNIITTVATLVSFFPLLFIYLCFFQ